MYEIVSWSIPDKSGAYMARLDRLGPAKEVAQVGAVIGSEFSYELLSAVHAIAEADLQQALRNLVI
jgi:predicted ATPase